MRAAANLSLWLLAFCFVLSGCSKSEMAPGPKPEGARLSPSEVIEIAKIVGATNGMKLGDYKAPRVDFQATKQKTWSVFFDGRVPMPGNHFAVFVDDQTGEAHYSPGR